MNQDIRDAIVGLAFIVTVVMNLYTYTRNKRTDANALEERLDTHNDRIHALETKVGLFWNLVEEHMSGMLAKANPIQLTEAEKIAAQLYRYDKSKSETHVLQTLNVAIARELRKEYMTPDEVGVFVCVLGAIKAQLVDRGEPIDDNT